jgi:hypothetical protein
VLQYFHSVDSVDKIAFACEKYELPPLTLRSLSKSSTTVDSLLVFFEENAIGKARPDQALYEQLSREEAAYIDRAAEIAAALGVTFSASGAASEPGMKPQTQRQRLAMVDVSPALDRHVHHRQRSCPAASRRFRSAVTRTTPSATPRI